MASDTTHDALPIAKAILQWSDPDLVEAVRVAERRYIPHDLNEFYRMTGGFRFRILPDAAVRNPQGGDWMGGPSFDWLIAAWTALEADFRRRLAGTIYLRGVQLSPTPDTVAASIPQAWASDAKFDMIRGAIEVVGRRYAAVTASITAPKIAGSAVPRASPAPIEDAGANRISLEDARLLGAPDELVANFQKLHAQVEIGKALDAGRVPKGYEAASGHVWLTPTADIKQEIRRQYEVAGAAIDAEFRSRVERAEVKLIGLQLRPALGTEHVTLAPAWASRMVFDWERQSVQVEGTLFVDVWALLTVPEEPAVDAPRASRGRPAFPFDKMVAIAKTRLSSRAATNRGEAKVLLDEFERLHPGQAKPAFDTVCDHITRIYTTAAAGTVPIKPPK